MPDAISSKGARDNAGLTVIGHILIRDRDSGAVLVNQRDRPTPNQAFEQKPNEQSPR